MSKYDLDVSTGNVLELPGQIIIIKAVIKVISSGCSLIEPTLKSLLINSLSRKSCNNNY